MRLAALALVSLLAFPASAQTLERARHGEIERAVARLTPADGLRAAPGLTLTPQALVATEAGRSVVYRADVPLGAPAPFLGLAVSWAASGPAADAVRLRTSEHGWRTLHADAHGPDRHGAADALRSAHVVASPATRWVEVELAVPLGSALQRVQLAFVSPGASDEAPAVAPEGAFRAASPERPPVVSRTAWGCPDGQSSPLWTPTPIEVTHVAVHHTAGGGAAADFAGYVRFVWDLHTNINGWGDIGYNYLVDPNGVVYEGRAGGSETVDIQGAHALGTAPGTSANPYSMGVALIGSFQASLPTPAARASLVELVAWKVAQKGLDAEGDAFMPTLGSVPVVFGHRDVLATECPGGAFYATLPALRADIADAASAGAAPNLTLGGCAVSPRPGDRPALAFRCTVRNDGAGAAGASALGLFLSSDADLDATDVPLASRPVAPLAPGQSVAVRGRTPAPASADGLYVLLAADPTGAVAESDESDNVAAFLLGSRTDCPAGSCGGAPAHAASVAAPGELALGPVVPNPAGAHATVAVSLPEAAGVRVSVLDALGRLAAAPELSALPAGLHTLPLTTERLAAGPYVVIVTAGGRAVSKRFSVVR